MSMHGLIQEDETLDITQDESDISMASPGFERNTKKGLSAFAASLAILSTIIGGGVVGLPYSFYQTGIPLGVACNIVFALLTFYSCVLFMKARNIVGNNAQ